MKVTKYRQCYLVQVASPHWESISLIEERKDLLWDVIYLQQGKIVRRFQVMKVYEPTIVKRKQEEKKS